MEIGSLLQLYRHRRWRLSETHQRQEVAFHQATQEKDQVREEQEEHESYGRL